MLRFVKQFFIYGFASLLNKIVAIFLLPLYTRVLSQDEFGALSVLMACQGIIDVFSNLNIHSGVARDFYEKDIDRARLVSTGFISVIISSVFILVLMLIKKDYWVNDILEIKKYENAFVYMSLTIPLGSIFSYLAILTRYQHKAISYSIITLIQLIVQISFTVYFILIIRTGIEGVFYGMILGLAVGSMGFYYLNRMYFKFTYDKKLIFRVLKYSLPTLPAIIAIWADSNIGQILIGKYLSLEKAGIYSIALRIASIYLLINQAFGNVWFPFVYENLSKSTFKVDVIRIFNYTTLALLFISVNLSLLSKYIVLFLSSPDYIDASKLLILLTIPMSISILTQIVSIGPNISRNTKYISYSNLSGSVLNIILLAIFLPKFDIYAVPLSLIFSKFCVFFLSSYYTKKEVDIIYPFKNVLIITLLVILIFVIIYSDINELLLITILLSFNVLFFRYLICRYSMKMFYYPFICKLKE